MKTTLSFKFENKTYTSKPFDFEAMCLINDRHGDEKTGVFRMTSDCVDYMFRGTDGANVIEKLPNAERAKLCHAAWVMYTDVIKNV